MAKRKRKKNSWVLWSEGELKLIRKLYPLGKEKEIARRTGRTESAIKGRAQRLGVKGPEIQPAYPRWSKKELNLLRKLYPTTKAETIAERLGRSVHAVRLRIVKIGIKKKMGKTGRRRRK